MARQFCLRLHCEPDQSLLPVPRTVRRTIVTSAIVLRRVGYGEADLVVTLLGKETGRVSSLARGARKSLRRFGGGLGMGTNGVASLRERPGAELMSLESFDAQGDQRSIALDIAKAAHLAYALELCDRLCPARQPEPTVYAWLEAFLLRLADGRATAARLRTFELGLLGHLGLGPAIDRCTICGRSIGEAEDVRWRPREGGVACQSCSMAGESMGAATRGALSRLARASLGDGDSIDLPEDVQTGCRRAMVALLREYVHGPLRSLEFIEKMGSGMSTSR
jgi:DNA repair protein RecO (recombination protein O)